MAWAGSGRVSNRRIAADLRLAARRGDRAALAVAIDQMKTLALSPRYWERYLLLLGNPLARLVDLLVIKQGERIAHQKGGKPVRPTRRPSPARASRPAGRPAPGRGGPRRRRGPRGQPDGQPTLFDLP
jgi:hypothetical protein